MKIAIYMRVSTADQSIDLQRAELLPVAKAQYADQQVEEYVDVMSGTKAKRPALDLLIRDVERGRVRTVLCWKLDRLGRSLRHLVNLMADWQALGCTVCAVTQGIDTSTNAGRMAANMIGSIAEFEVETMRERIKAGMKAAKRRGVHCGRPVIDCDNKLLREMSLSGLSIREIASKTGLNRGTVQRRLATVQ
jgi:DNA invertase Pin-like site-specific DNA recombinase